MKKITQKEIKRLIKLGAATELTSGHDVKHNELECVGTSFGVYGMNGALFKHRGSGQLYAIPSRSTLLFYYR